MSGLSFPDAIPPFDPTTLAGMMAERDELRSALAGIGADFIAAVRERDTALAELADVSAEHERLHADLYEAHAAIERVKAVHKDNDIITSWCACGQRSPCPTIRALEVTL